MPCRPLERRCGDCSLCCTYLSVRRSDNKSNWKESWKHCKNCSGHKCIIYEKRPDSCRNFECLWLQSSDVPKRFRPDRVRAVLATSAEGNAIVVHCLEKDRHRILKGNNDFSCYILNLSKKTPMVIVTNEGSIPIGRFASRMNLLDHN